MVELVGIVILALLVGLSIALHEFGHLLPAKKFGIKVTDYMIGFGPTIWSTQRGETRYGLKAIPVGGFIRMIGMVPPGPDGRSRSLSTGRFAQLIDDARRQSAEEIEPGEEGRAFYRQPVHRRIIVMLGGPTMNLIFAFVLFAIVLIGIGLPQPTLQVASTAACTPTSAAASGAALPSGQCPTGSSASPAVTAGIQAGDTIVAIGGVPATDWSTATSWIRAHPGEQVTVTVDRAGQQVDLPLTIATAQRPVLDADGNPTDAVVTAGYIGVAPSFAWVSQPWTSVPAYMWDLTVRSVQALVSLPVRLYELVTQTLIGGGERSADSPVSVVGVSRLGGDVAATDEPFTAKVATFLGLVASLNLFLFLFNLIPLLPLDGGHVAGAVYEAIRRTVARWRHRPDPGPVDLARMMPVAYVVAGVLLAMGVVVIWADLVKPISLN